MLQDIQKLIKSFLLDFKGKAEISFLIFVIKIKFKDIVK